MDIAEIVKEFVVYQEGSEVMVRCRIEYCCDREKDPYMWTISHLWKAQKAFVAYSPSKRSFPTLEQAEKSLLSYLSGFSGESEIVPSEEGYYMITKMISPEGKVQEHEYSPIPSSAEMVTMTAGSTGVDFQPEDVEEWTQRVERERGFGGEFSLGLKAPGGWGFEFSKKAKTEKRVFTRKIKTKE